MRAIFARWDLEAVVIGRVTDDGVFRARWHGRGGVRAAGRRAHRRGARLPPAGRGAGAARGAAARSTSRDGPRAGRLHADAADAAREPEPLLARVGLPPVRPARRRQHGRPAGRRRRGRAHRGHAAGARADASTATAATAGSIRTSARCSRSSRRRATCVAVGARPLARHRLPQLRQPREARGDVAVPAGDRTASATPASRSARRSSAAT